MVKKILSLFFLISILSPMAFGNRDALAEGMIVLKNSGAFEVKVKCETGPYTSRVEMIRSIPLTRAEALLEEEPEPILKGSTILKENDSYTCTAQSIDLSFLPNHSTDESLGERFFNVFSSFLPNHSTDESLEDREMGHGGTWYSNHCSEPEKEKLCITVKGRLLEEQHKNFEVDVSDLSVGWREGELRSLKTSYDHECKDFSEDC